MHTLQSLFDLTKLTVLNVSDDNAARIAWLCFEAQQAGGMCAIWHASSIVHESERCACYECRAFVQ